ncbi:MAG: AfsA-related hotdog domain-containing protein [Kineosporiaceae bacterium]
MREDAVTVVGDTFDVFLANPGTMAASDLLAHLRAEEPVPATITMGQGITAEQADEIRHLLAGTDRLAAAAPAPADRRLTHKHDRRNALVGPPERVADDHFTVELIVDGRTETLSDHITGQHLPAITLTEAARQAWTAVTEEFLLGEIDEPHRFVVVSFRSAFDNYVFPLAATLHYRLLTHDRTGLGHLFRCRVEVEQNGGVAAAVEAEYRVLPETISAKQESLAARRALTTHLSAAREASGASTPQPAPVAG